MDILICDDMKNEADKIAGLIQESDFDVMLNIFQNSKDILAYICSQTIQLTFLYRRTRIFFRCSVPV